MKRYHALTAALILAAGALAAVLVLVGGVGRLPAVFAHSVGVDGNMNDWITFPTPPENNGHVMRNTLYEGEFLWTDAAGDHRADGADPDSNYDLTEFRVTADTANLYFLLRFSDLTNANLPYVGIAVDTTHDGSGNAAFGDAADVQTHADAEWERQIVVNSNRTGYFDASYTFNAAGSSNISAAADLIEISMPLSDLGIALTNGAMVRFTVMVGEHDGFGGIVEQTDPDVLDVVTTADTTFPGEVSDTDDVIDYYFDIYFEPDGDPTSPLQVSEVFYNPAGGTLADELPNEFIELYNPAQYLAYLDGKVLGDQPLAGGEDHEGQFQFPDTPLTGTNHVVQPGEYIVVALDAETYDDDPVFPDHYWADWELFQGLTGEFDNPDVLNLSLVSNSGPTPIHLTMGNNGDNVVLADGTITASIPPSNTVVDGMNYATWNEPVNGEAPADTSIRELDVSGGSPSATEGNSVQRDYSRVTPDTNNSLTDFGPGNTNTPTPGFAIGLIDHAIYKKGPSVVQAGEVFTYSLYYQVAGQQAPSAVITDVLPANVHFITYTATSPITLTDDIEPSIVWDLGDVPASSVGKLIVIVQLDFAAPAGVLTQTASIGSQSATAEGITDNDTFVLTSVAEAPDLAITKTVEAATPVHLGDSITYTVVVANHGNADATGVHVTDSLPTGVTGTDLDQTVTVTAGDQVEFTISAVVTTNISFYGQTITNTAHYIHTSRSGSDDAAFTIIGPPILSIVKTVETAHDPVHLGDPITYTVVVANTGADDAAGVHITDALPVGVVGSDLDATRTVTAGEQVELTIAGTVTDDISFYGATIVNTAYYDHATGSGSDDDGGFTILTPEIEITSPTEGQTFQSPDGVSATIPITVTTSDFIIPDDGHWHLWVDGAMIGPVLAYDTTTNLLLGTHVISAELRSPSHEIIGPVDTVTITITPPAPDLAIAKTVELPRDPVHLGDVVTYTVSIQNNGFGTATGVEMTDALPAGVSFGGWVDQGSAQLPPPEDTITWGPWDIAGGGQHSFIFTATVTTDTGFYGQTITNTAEYDSVDAGSGSADVSFTIVSPAQADLSGSTKVASTSQQIMPGDLVTYTITLINSGGLDANALVTDVLGSYYSVFDAGDLSEGPAGTLTWSGLVPAGQQVVLQFVVQVADMADLPFGVTTLNNAAQIYDGVAVYDVSAASSPTVEIYGIFLPLVLRNN
jgi:uncharacterized repeat protein (TIGR01451 family)